MRRHWVYSIAILLVAVGALAFRLPRLDMRPMHPDEGNQAYKAGVLLDQGIYRYDPHQHHGPTLYFLTLPSCWLGGARSFADTADAHFRIVPVVFGVGLVGLLWVAGAGLGWPAALCAGVLTAVSPAMVFYSRYYIQEMLLVFFTFGAIASGWRYTWTQKARWAVLAGVFLGLMHATKETCVLAYAAMGLAVLGKLTWRRWWGHPITIHKLLHRWHVVAGVVAALVVSVVFFSSFFTHWRGPLDSVLTYTHYLHRSGGDGLHDHPWHYYLKMLLYTHVARGPWWSEAFVMALALVGFVAVLHPQGIPEATTPLARFVAFYTLFLTAFYCVIPYKTPWCLLGFLHGMILLAGVGAVVVVHLSPGRVGKGVAVALLAVGGWLFGAEAYNTSFKFHTDRRNPYVYAHTSRDVLNLAERVADIAKVDPRGNEMLVHVIAADRDYWPMPYYLRKLRNVGYWSDVPDDLDSSMIIFHDSFQEAVDAALRRGKPDGWKPEDDWESFVYGLRPTVHLMAYIRKPLWHEFIQTRSTP